MSMKNSLETKSTMINNAYSIRTEMYDGKAHIVVPVIMMKEGVHSGSQGPIFHSSSELSKMVDAWNGIPAVIYHPKDSDGDYISANSPTVPYVGKIFNTNFSDGALRAEVWLNKEKLSSISPLAAAYIKQQKPLDVSVGVFTDTEMMVGEWNDESYIGVAKNYRPDHLALLPGETGACSWEDGCGIRVNIETNGGKGSGNFGHKGIPGHQGGSGDGGGGEDTAISEFLDTSEGKKYVELLKKSFKAEQELRKGPHSKGLSQKVRNAQLDEINFRTKNKALVEEKGLSWWQVDDKIKSKHKLQHNNMETIFAINSLQDRKTEFRELCDKVGSKLYSMDNDFAYHYPVEIYDDGVIYLSRNRQSGKETFYQQKYSVDEETGELTFEDDPQKVVRKTNYEVQTNQQNNKNQKGENKMEKSKCFIGKVDALIAHERTNFTEEDREELMEMEESMLDKIMPKMARTKPAEVEVNEQQVMDFIKSKPEDQVIKLLPEGMQVNINAAIQEKAAKREAVITGIMAHEKNEWKKEELTAMSCENLAKIAKMIGAEGSPADYSAKPEGGDTKIQSNASAQGEVLLPPGVEA